MARRPKTPVIALVNGVTAMRWGSMLRALAPAVVRELLVRVLSLERTG